MTDWATLDDPALEPAAVVSAVEALALAPPERVVWSIDYGAAVVSVGEPGILAAPGGSGKSWVALGVALAAVSGTPAACGLHVRPGPVLMVSYEDAPARIGGRLRALRRHADDPALSRLLLVADPEALWTAPERPGAGRAVPTAAFAALRRRVEALRPSLLILDPVSAAAPAMNDGAAARSCMRDLAALSADTGAGVLVIAHDTKAARHAAAAGGNPGAGAVAGSAQWFDAARAVLYLRRPEADEAFEGGAGSRKLECLKCNHGADGWSIYLEE